MRRKVTIKTTERGHFVCYVDRKKGGHYTAAQFALDMRTREQVAEWIKGQPKLELV